MSLVGRLLLVSLIFVLGAPALSAAENTLTSEEISDGWLLLFDGETTFGWEPGSDANWGVKDGVIRASEGKPGLLCTTSEFADYQLKVDFRCPMETNSGVFLRTPVKPTDPARDCYELNIASPQVSPFFTGSFVNREMALRYQPASDWQTFDVTVQGGHFVVKLDGEKLLDYNDTNPLGRGRIGLQFRSGWIEFRNIKLKPLGLEPIFNGRDLKGWREFPGLPSVFTVTPAGELNVKNGKGQLETVGRYGDFTLQWQVFSNGKHLNSGIFFRSIPGEYQNGYEVQVQNGYKDGDRTKPLDFGTGAIYRRQPARKVVSDDFKWVSMTLVATGNHIATWVEGFPVVDWTDTRPPHDNPRNGLRTAPGTIIIQGHDPTTDLSFKNIYVREMPAR